MVLMIDEAPINFVAEQFEEEPVLEKPVKPARPRITKKPVTPPTNPIPVPEPVMQPTIPIQQPIKEEKKPLFSNPNQPKETMGYDTLNPLIYKFYNYLLLPSLLVIILVLVLIAINVIWFPDLVWNLYGEIIILVFAIINFGLIFLIASTSLKKNDLIVIRKFRSGAGTISRTNIRGLSEIYFNKRDLTSKVSIAWSGAITDVVSGCKIIQISEGHPTNDNLNAQVSESEWDKDVARLTKAKSVADLAEAELFNQGLLGLKWQDLVLIMLVILSLAIIGYLIMGAPDAIAKKTIEGLMNGTIQQAIGQTLSSAGILTPAATP
jgi:hypothetical protein